MMMTPRLESKPSISTRSCVEGLLAFVVAADGAAAAGFAQGVEFVDEDDAGGPALGLAEQIADPAGADADEHLDEVGAAHAEERHVGLAGDRLGQQRLAGAGRADEQDALGNAAAEGLVFLRRLEEIDDLAQFVDGLVDAGHVLEGDLQVLLGVELVPAAAEGEGRIAARHPADREKPAVSNMTSKHDGHAACEPKARRGPSSSST